MAHLNHHARELRNTLDALGFEFDEDESIRRGGSYYHHANQPDQYIKVFGHISPMAARNAMDKARQVAGLAVVGRPASAAIKANARLRRSDEKVAELQRRLSVERRADEIGLQRDRRRQAAARDRELREIRDLMRPVGTPSTPGRPWDSHR